MHRLSLEEIKKTELDILLELKEVCRRHSLRYCLCGGTLLGAVRHRGFIPWDDDIDVFMPRYALKKLIRLEKEEHVLPPHLKLISREDGSFDYPYAKIVDTRTHIRMQYLEGGNEEHIWIDILPVDGMPEDERQLRAAMKTAGLIRTVLGLNFAVRGEGKTAFRRLMKPLLIPAAKAVGTDRCNRAMDALVRRYPFRTSDYCGCLVWGLYGPGERMKKSEFMEMVPVRFEGHTFPAMSCWDSYLRGLYGDYMQLPPEEKRVTHDMDAWIEDEA